MSFAINELIRTTQYALLLQIFFHEQLFVKKQRAVALIVIYFLGFCGLMLLEQESKLYLLGATVQIAMSILFLREQWYGKALSILTLLSVPSIMVLCFNEFNGYFFNGYNKVWFWEKNQVVSGDAEFFLVTLLLFLLSRKEKLVLFVSNKSKCFLSLISILFLIVLDWCMSTESSIDSTMMILMILCNLLLVCVCIWVLFIESSWKQNQLQMEQYTQYVKRLEDEHDAVRSMYHDLKHHFQALDSYAQSDDMDSLKQYLSDLETEINTNTESSYTHYTKNPLFNAILSEKQNKAEAAGVQIVFRGNLDRDIFVRAYDLCIIVSNLMDNALEHAEKAGSRKIEVYASQEDRCILLQFVNNVPPSAEVKIGKTSKEDKFIHGYGLKNVKKAAERYYGDFDIYIKNGKCIAKIMLMHV